MKAENNFCDLNDHSLAGGLFQSSVGGDIVECDEFVPEASTRTDVSIRRGRRLPRDASGI